MCGSLTRAAVISFVFPFFVSGCFSPKVVGRYEKCTIGKYRCSEQTPEMDVSVIFNPAPESVVNPKRGSDLPEKAQAAYINALSKKSKTNEELRREFSQEIKNESDESVQLDTTSFKGTLIITVSDIGPLIPADRLERTEVEITFDKVNIDSWTAVQTIYNTISAGILKTNIQKGVELDVGTPSSPTLPAVTGKASIQSINADEMDVSLRLEDVTPIFDPIKRSIKIFRHGGIGLNLVGNVLLHATFTPMPGFTAYPRFFSIKTKNDGKWIKPEKLILNTQLAKEPRGLENVKGTVTLTYTIRHVVKGDESYQERDDFVELITKHVTHSFVMLPAAHLKHQSYALVNPLQRREMIAVQREGNSDASYLCFANYEGAEAFLDYLRRPGAISPATVGSARIGFKNPKTHDEFLELNKETVANLKIESGCLPP